METSELDFPGKKLQLDLYLSENSPKSITALAIDAISKFNNNFISPLSADLSLSYFNSKFNFTVDKPEPKQKFWSICSDQMPPFVDCKEAWEQSRIQKTNTLNSPSLLDWITSAILCESDMANSIENSLYLNWQEILIRALRVRLPYTSEVIDENCITLRRGTSSITYPVEQNDNHLYVSGPLHIKTVVAPFEFQILNEGNFLSLNISVFWSLWANPSEKGWFQLNEVVQNLIKTDWKCSYSQIDGIVPNN